MRAWEGDKKIPILKINDVISLQLSFDDQLLVARTKDHGVTLWNVKQGNTTKRYKNRAPSFTMKKSRRLPKIKPMDLFFAKTKKCQKYFGMSLVIYKTLRGKLFLI